MRSLTILRLRNRARTTYRKWSLIILLIYMLQRKDFNIFLASRLLLHRNISCFCEWNLRLIIFLTSFHGAFLLSWPCLFQICGSTFYAKNIAILSSKLLILTDSICIQFIFNINLRLLFKTLHIFILSLQLL